jgi:pyruvate dehydrogenase E2 component (dihydrolipoamide acetyltransferase)
MATAKGDATTVELTRTQQSLARRMAESKATIPHLALQLDVDMERCVELRAELERVPAAGGASHAGVDDPALPTYDDLIVKACALALREHPRVNSSYRDGSVQLHPRVNVSVAVAADDSAVLPTVFDADEKSLAEIAHETRALSERVRAGTITPPELGGATFAVSNLGMFGVRSFTPIVNPPQVAILAVGSIERRCVAASDEGSSEQAAARDDGGSSEPVIAVRHTMTLTLVCDNRVLYGADAAQFLARIRELLQTPSALTP